MPRLPVLQPAAVMGCSMDYSLILVMLGTAVLSRMELNQSNLDLNDVPNQTRNRNPNDLENQLANMFSESE